MAKEPLPSKELLPAWTTSDLESETESMSAERTEDAVQPLTPARDGRLQVHLSGFPRQRIRLSAEQSQGSVLSIVVSSREKLPGTVEEEEEGSLNLYIDAPETAAVHRRPNTAQTFG